MGLEMYMIKIKKEDARGIFDYQQVSEEDIIKEWYKYTEYDKLMHTLYLKKGGKGRFNLKPMMLTLEDLNYIEQYHRLNIKESMQKYPHLYEGKPFKEVFRDATEYIRHARYIIGKGDFVYYINWW